MKFKLSNKDLLRRVDNQKYYILEELKYLEYILNQTTVALDYSFDAETRDLANQINLYFGFIKKFIERGLTNDKNRPKWG